MEPPSRIREAFFACYPACWRPRRIERLGRHAGLSGGSVYRAQCPAGPAAWRRWIDAYPLDRLPAVHRVQSLARAGGMDQVAVPIADCRARTWQELAGGLWELCTWMPGAPDLSGAPSAERLADAAQVLARFHNVVGADRLVGLADRLAGPALVSAFRAGQPAKSPGLARRRREWDRLRSLCAPAATDGSDPLQLAGRTVRLAGQLAEPIERALVAAADPVSLVVSLRDVHREHVLYTGERVTGLVDFGALGLDSPACDLGRLLGSLVPDRPDDWSLAMDAYRSERDLDPGEARLAAVFDFTGTMIGALHWLEWLGIERRHFPDRQMAYARWRTLVERLEQNVSGEW